MKIYNQLVQPRKFLFLFFMPFCTLGFSQLSFDCICPDIISQTVATMPSNQGRTKLGVGEEVILELDDPSVTPVWSIVGDPLGGVINNSNMPTALFRAGTVANQTIIRAEITNPPCIIEIQFDIVTPSVIVMDCPIEVADRLCMHKPFTPSGGMFIQPYIQPIDVSFYNIQLQEQEVLSSTYLKTGYWENLTVQNHSQGPWNDGTSDFDQILGTKVVDLDKVGFVGSLVSTNGVGQLKLDIPVKYRVKMTVDEYIISSLDYHQGIESYEDDGYYIEEVFKPQYSHTYFRDNAFWVNNPLIFIDCNFDNQGNDYECD